MANKKHDIKKDQGKKSTNAQEGRAKTGEE
jgi:hypothetical protein